MRQWSPAVLAIQGYQQYISPHKGFCCAYRIDTGGPSCSEYAKQAIKKNGFFQAIKPIREQFSACKTSAENLKEENKKKTLTVLIQQMHASVRHLVEKSPQPPKLQQQVLLKQSLALCSNLF